MLNGSFVPSNFCFAKKTHVGARGGWQSPCLTSTPT
jgi:hypothetical protein